MPRNDQIVRILSVARALAASRRGVSLTALAEREGWHWRTVYRDRDALQRAGFPIEEPVPGRYKLADGWAVPNLPGIESELSSGGTATADFIYGGDGHRIVQEAGGGGATTARTVYVALGATGKSLYERTKRGATTEHAHFIYAGTAHGGNAFAVRLVTQEGGSATTATKYYLLDHLGSVTAVSDEQGHVVDPETGGRSPGVLSYDAWGARRASEHDAASPTSFDLPTGHREFTGHETIPGVGLVNMNGRVYDPLLGRFLSPDPNIQFVANLQSYNRYSYALNNPLRYTDPTGFFINGYFDFAVVLGISVAGVIACPETGGAGCALAFTMAATLYSAASAKAAGASYGQVALITLAGLVGGGIGGAFAGAATSELGSGIGTTILAGAVSGAASSFFTTPITAAITDRQLTGRQLGQGVLLGACTGAFAAAATYAFRNDAQVSRGSAGAARQAGGSGGTRVESAEKLDALLADAGAGRGGTTDEDLLSAFPDASRRRPYIDIARGELGVAEVPGRGSNPRVLEYLRSTDLPEAMANTDATPWCSAFANWSVEQAGGEGTGSAWSLSWRQWGEHTDEPSYGAVAIMDEGNGHGHVTFVAGQTPDGHVVFLGGNQSDSVNYTIGYHITEYRLPAGATPVPLPIILDPVHRAGGIR